MKLIIFNKMKILTWICLLSCWSFFTAQAQQKLWTYQKGGLRFEWNLADDLAKLTEVSGGAVTWQGGLLPSFRIKNDKGQFQYLKARVQGTLPTFSGSKLEIPLVLEKYGTGTLVLERAAWGIHISKVAIQWLGKAPAVIEMYIGASPVSGANVKPVWDRPFLPSWQTMGYCVPGA